MTRDMLVRMAGILPQELVLDMLATTLQEYKADKSDENKRKLHMHLSLTVLNFMTGDVGTDKLSAELDNIHRIREMFKSTN